MDDHGNEWGLVPEESSSTDNLRRQKPAWMEAIDQTKLPFATHSGVVPVSGFPIPSAVLNTGDRVLTQQGFLRAMDRARAAKGGQGATVDSLPAFLAAKNLLPFITPQVLKLTVPIIYRPLEGGYHGIAFGYRCELLPSACQVWVDALHAGALRESQKRIAARCDLLLRGLQVVGIAALVDEATGFQADRTRDAMQEILRQFISEELVQWAKMFPDEFYSELFRLRGLPRSEFTNKRPKYFGHLTNDIIYARLAPNVLDELRRLTPRDEKGRKKNKLFQRLTEHVGHPKLREHLSNVITLMKASPNDKVFMRLLNRAKPRYKDLLSGQTSLALDLRDDDGFGED